MLNVDEVIEDNDGAEFDVFERELAKLSDDQLTKIVAAEGVYKADEAKGEHRDFLEIAAAEVTWKEFFAAYQQVVGSPFELDR